MGGGFRQRLTYANVVSTLCLFVALGGTAVAAGGLINGNQIKNHSIAGKKLEPHTLTASEINLSALGTVPTAANARRLGGIPANGYVRTGTVVPNASNATELGGVPASGYLRSGSIVTFKHTATAGNSLHNYSCIDNSAINGDPTAVVVVEHEFIGLTGPYNNHPTGVWYDIQDANYPALFDHWCIYNEDGNTPIPTGSVWDVVAWP